MNPRMNHLIYNIVKLPYILPAWFILIGFIVLIANQEKNEILNYLGFFLLLIGFFLVIVEMLYYMFLSDEQNNNVVNQAPHAEPEMTWEELKTMDNISVVSDESDLDIVVIFDI